jgi:hypothetical protein
VIAVFPYALSHLGHTAPIRNRGKPIGPKISKKLSSSRLSLGPRIKSPKNKIIDTMNAIRDIILIFFIGLTLISICFYFQQIG